MFEATILALNIQIVTMLIDLCMLWIALYDFYHYR